MSDESTDTRLPTNHGDALVQGVEAFLRMVEEGRIVTIPSARDRLRAMAEGRATMQLDLELPSENVSLPNEVVTEIAELLGDAKSSIAWHLEEQEPFGMDEEEVADGDRAWLEKYRALGERLAKARE